MKKRYVFISWVIITLATLIVHRMLLQSEREQTRRTANEFEAEVPQVQHLKDADTAEGDTPSQGMELIHQADPQLYSSPGEEAPIYHSRARLSDPEYKKMYLRHKALHMYLNAAARGTEGFRQITDLLKAYGYDEEYVYHFYDVVYAYSKQKESLKEQTFHSVWAGQPATPEKFEVYDQMIRLRQKHRKDVWVDLLVEATGIDNLDLLQEAFDIELTEPFGIRGHPEPAEGEELIQQLK